MNKFILNCFVGCSLISTSLFAGTYSNSENMSSDREYLGLAGFSASSASNYGYLGLITTLDDNKLSQDGIKLRLWAYRSEYDYDNTNLGNIEVDGFGTSASLGYRFTYEDIVSTFYAGVAAQDIASNPSDNSNETDEDTFGGVFSYELQKAELFAGIGLSTIANYETFGESYWVRVRPSYDLLGLTVGPEYISTAGEEWDQQRFGAYVSGFDVKGLTVGINAGLEKDNAERFYSGISLSKNF
mgnify:CR=1 FL=1